ncbi:MAG: hypothetical protein JW772_03080 [Candidatus Diapherotrites archaeon]|nr:hypothetical protein [Candidatus Diapherotrites archaeon]
MPKETVKIPEIGPLSGQEITKVVQMVVEGGNKNRKNASGPKIQLKLFPPEIERTGSKSVEADLEQIGAAATLGYTRSMLELHLKKARRLVYLRFDGMLVLLPKTLPNLDQKIAESINRRNKQIAETRRRISKMRRRKKQPIIKFPEKKAKRRRS